MNHAALSTSLPASPPAARRRPIVTAAVLLATAIVTGLQFRYPEILSALDRRPAAYAQGQWWRWLTALLVHDEGWPQIVCNLTALALIGVCVERLFGRAWWIAYYLLGGLVGQFAGAFWQPQGAGASVAIAGLLGALLAWLLLRGQALSWRVRIWGALGLLAAVILTAFRDIHGPPILAAAGLAAIVGARSARPITSRASETTIDSQ